MRRVIIGLVAAGTLAAFPERAPGQRATTDDRAWSTPHVVLAGGFALALLIDAAQTREAMRHGYVEMNPLLGPHPSVAQVNAYTAVTGLAVVGAAAALPVRLRPWVLGIALAVETFTVAGTARAGISLRFP